MGAEHARQQREAITARLMALAKAGAKYSELAVELEKIERGSNPLPVRDT